jgi:hypothetical protein
VSGVRDPILQVVRVHAGVQVRSAQGKPSRVADVGFRPDVEHDLAGASCVLVPSTAGSLPQTGETTGVAIGGTGRDRGRVHRARPRVRRQSRRRHAAPG